VHVLTAYRHDSCRTPHERMIRPSVLFMDIVGPIVSFAPLCNISL